MTDNTQSGYESGRAKAFQAIRDLIRMDLDKMAFTAVNDQMGMGQQPDPREIARVKAGLESLNNYCVAVLDSLEAGETVYSLTGAEEIRTYKNITGGDELAGVHSAAEDMKIMLMSMDLDEVGKPFSAPKGQKKEDDSQFAATYRGAKVPDDPYLSYGLAIVYETMLGRIEEKIVTKTPAPKVIGLDGAAPQPGKSSLLGTAFRKLAEQEHSSGRLMRRSSKVPNLWPPLKNGMQMPGLGLGPGATQALPEPDQTPNSEPEFAEGYVDALRLLFKDMQEAHFKAASGAQDYAQKVGLGPSWDKIVTGTAKDLFNELRMEVQERIQDNDTRGLGDSYADGFEAARDWVKYKISTLEVKQNWDRNPNMEQAAAKLRSYWMNQTDNIINSVLGHEEPAKKPVQPVRKAPAPKPPM